MYKIAMKRGYEFERERVGICGMFWKVEMMRLY